MGPACHIGCDGPQHQARNTVLVARATDDVVITIVFRVLHNGRRRFPRLEGHLLDRLHIGGAGDAGGSIQNLLHLGIIH